MAYSPSQSRTQTQHESQEPNLIPIMNLFIVIIPMLMTIMVSVHLAMIQITLPTRGAGGNGEEQALEEAEETPKIITLFLLPSEFVIQVEGGEEIKLPKLENGNYDYFGLDKTIAHLKEQHENQKTVELLPDPQVKFDVLLRSIDLCKSNDFPNITYLTSSTKFYRSTQ